jgi:ABC-2 type transport system ATP-binding protein
MNVRGRRTSIKRVSVLSERNDPTDSHTVCNAQTVGETRMRMDASKPEEPPALLLRGVSRSFKGKQALRPLDLQLRSGERAIVRGPNGTGKTTLLRCIAGTLHPSAGEAWVCGHRAGTLAAQRLVGCSLATDRSFYLRLTGRVNLRFFSRLRHSTERAALEDVESVIEELEIESIVQQRLDRCSTGMLQQVGLARALLGAPALLLLDEPTRSLDAAATRRLWAALERRPNTAALIASHREEDLERCERHIDLGR